MPGGRGRSRGEGTSGGGGGAVRPWLLASPAALAGVQREHPAGDGAEREPPGVARARRRGPERAALRPWRWLRRAQAAMGLLRLMALAALASQPGVAGGAETVGNASVGKLGAPPSAPRGAFAFPARSEVHPRSVRLAAEAAGTEAAGAGQGPSRRRKCPLLARRPHSGCGSGKRCVSLLFAHIPAALGGHRVRGFHWPLESTAWLPSGGAEPWDRQACRTRGSASLGPADAQVFLLPSRDAFLTGELHGVAEEERTQIGLLRS